MLLVVNVLTTLNCCGLLHLYGRLIAPLWAFAPHHLWAVSYSAFSVYMGSSRRCGSLLSPCIFLTEMGFSSYFSVSLLLFLGSFVTEISFGFSLITALSVYISRNITRCGLTSLVRVGISQQEVSSPLFLCGFKECNKKDIPFFRFTECPLGNFYSLMLKY